MGLFGDLVALRSFLVAWRACTVLQERIAPSSFVLVGFLNLEGVGSLSLLAVSGRHYRERETFFEDGGCNETSATRSKLEKSPKT